MQTKCYSLHLPLQCSIWGCTCIYYFIVGNKHKLGVKIISLWQSSNLYVRGTILQTHLYSQRGKKLLEQRALEIKPWMLPRINKKQSYTKSCRPHFGLAELTRAAASDIFPRQLKGTGGKSICVHTCISCAYTQAHTLYLFMHLTRFLLYSK